MSHHTLGTVPAGERLCFHWTVSDPYPVQAHKVKAFLLGKRETRVLGEAACSVLPSSLWGPLTYPSRLLDAQRQQGGLDQGSGGEKWKA